MKNFNSKSQHGAVLAFCLVMLLLLTLAGTRMIQQNKQQLEMANSSRLLTQEFANAEGVLANAKNQINLDPAHIDSDPDVAPSNPAHQCVPTNTGKQNTLLPGLVNGAPGSTILSTACIATSGATVKCVTYSAGKLTCYPKSGGTAGVDCTGKTVAEITALFDKSCPSYDTATKKFTCGDNPIDDDCTNQTVLKRAEMCDQRLKESDSPLSYRYDMCYQVYDPQCNYETDNNPTCTGFPPRCPKEIYTIQVISTDANGTTRQIVSDHVVGCGS